jgi:enoyl-CoA hydratase
MNAAPLVTASRDGRVATIRLNRPEKRNALNSALIAAATATLARFADEIEPLVIVLSGEGPAFSAGADVQELRSLNEESARDFITRLHALIATVRDLPQIVIAAIRGPCLGGALELAAACDLRIAAENARFGMPEVRVGIPSVIEAALLPALIGLGRAADLVLTGETMDAAWAERCGLVSRVVPDAALDAEAQALAQRLASLSGPALRAQKRLIRGWPGAVIDASVQESIAAFAEMYRTPNPAEAIGALLEGRPPRFAVP